MTCNLANFRGGALLQVGGDGGVERELERLLPALERQGGRAGKQ